VSDESFELPSHFGLLCEALDRLLGPIWGDWDGLRNGHVHVVRHEAATFEAYRGAVMAQMRDLTEIVGTLERVCNELLRDALHGNPNITPEQVSLAAKRYADLVRQMLKVRTKLTAISPPEGWGEMHAGLLAAVDEQMQVARGLHEDLLRIQAQPAGAVDSDGVERVRMAFGGPALDRLSPLWKETLERTQGRSGPTCAVVTACFGDEDAPEVVRMREWREAALRPSRVGRAICRAYTAVSPTVATLFKLSPVLAAAGRMGVRGFLAWHCPVVPGNDDTKVG